MPTLRSTSLLILVLGLGPLSCGDDNPNIAIAEALHDDIEGFEEWAQHPEFEGIQPSSDGTHGPYVQVWMNDIAAAQSGDFSGTFDDGSIFVKRGYDANDAGSVRSFYTVMKKIAGHDSKNGDWFYARIQDSGSVDSAGPAGCASCHADGKDNGDYVRFIGDLNITF